MIIEELCPLKGRVRIYEVENGSMELVVDQDNMILDAFIAAMFSGWSDSLGYQSIGDGVAEPQGDGVGFAETFRKARNQVGFADNQFIISTTLGERDGNVPQGLVIQGHAGSANPSKSMWTVAPDLTGLDPITSAYVAAYFKRYRVGSLIRIGLGAGSQTYVFAKLATVQYNAAGTECTLTIEAPLSDFPEYHATIDGVLNEAAIIADYPAVQTMGANPTLASFTCEHPEYFKAGDPVVMRRPNGVTLPGGSGAIMDLIQLGQVAEVSGSTVTLVAPGWAVQFPATGINPASAVVAPQAGDQVLGGKRYNWVSGLRYVKSRQKTTIVETVITTVTE